MTRIYITHCSAAKDASLEGSGEKVTPDKLYTAAPLQRFVRTCQEMGADWAIFSDKYGVIFPREKIPWYEKHPSKVTDAEYLKLLAGFIQRLGGYDEIWFYHNPGRFHPLYKRLVTEIQAAGKNIHLFTHLMDIGWGPDK